MIRDLANDERPREKLIKYGAKYLTDKEILAIILNSGTKKKSVLDLAEDILKKYTISELLSLPYEILIKIPGIKVSKATKIMAAFELSRRGLVSPELKIDFTNPKSIYDYIISDYLYVQNEVITLLLLDSKLRLIKKIVLNEGILTQVDINIRTIVNLLIKYEASGIVLIHNHPSGDCKPSLADKMSTTKLYKILEDLQFSLVDHLIITKSSYFSFAENYLLENM